jgi:hypothetical protein
MVYARMLYQLYGAGGRNYCDVDRVSHKFGEIFQAYLRYSTMGATELAVTEGLLLGSHTELQRVTMVSGLTREQQRIYRQLYLDTDGRADMSMVIVPLLLEPSQRAASPEDVFSNPEQPRIAQKQSSRGQSINTLFRLVGYYAGPVVVEMLYSNLLRSSMLPEGRDSAQRWMNDAQLGAVRAKGYMASLLLDYNAQYTDELMRMSVKLAFEEREEGQAEIITNVQALLSSWKPRIGNTQQVYASLPQDALTGEFELTHEEMVEAAQTGLVPQAVKALTVERPQPKLKLKTKQKAGVK